MNEIKAAFDSVYINPNETLTLPNKESLVGNVEKFLYALCSLDYENLPVPLSRIEELVNGIITNKIPNIEPQSRTEQFFLAILSGDISELPEPQSRSEMLLDKLARGDSYIANCEPIQSRYELLLAYLIKHGELNDINYVLYKFCNEMNIMYNTIEKPIKSAILSGADVEEVLKEMLEVEELPQELL